LQENEKQKSLNKNNTERILTDVSRERESATKRRNDVSFQRFKFCSRRRSVVRQKKKARTVKEKTASPSRMNQGAGHAEGGDQRPRPKNRI